MIEDFTYSSSPNETGTLAWTDAGGDPVVWDPAVGASGTVSGLVRSTRFFQPAQPPEQLCQPFEGRPRQVEFWLEVVPSAE